MKDINQLIKDLEQIGVFEYKDKEYLCTGYDFDITTYFVDLHKKLIDEKMSGTFHVVY